MAQLAHKVSRDFKGLVVATAQTVCKVRVALRAREVQLDLQVAAAEDFLFAMHLVY
jgi:hypothetical protein